MDAIAQTFIDKSRRLMTSDYLPKIERCLDELADDDIWYVYRDGKPVNGAGSDEVSP